ncbi:MAG: hypothetical protein Q9M50_14295 [Methylococcales bacterium]|nr:hypothetical protein [Methylococcales bacterium]
MPKSNHKNHLALYDYSKLLKNAVTALKHRGIGRIHVNKVESSQQENVLDVHIDYFKGLNVLNAEQFRFFNEIGVYRISITNHVNLIWSKRK